jgi:hypothetical protein
MVGKGLYPMMSFEMFLRPLQKMPSFMLFGNKPTFFQHLPFNFFVNKCKVDGICTLVDVIIVDIIQVNLVSQAAFSCGLAPSLMAQVKEGFYYDHY